MSLNVHSVFPTKSLRSDSRRAFLVFDFKQCRIINSIGTKDASFSKRRRPNWIRRFETEPKSFVAKDLNWRKKMTSKRFRE